MRIRTLKALVVLLVLACTALVIQVIVTTRSAGPPSPAHEVLPLLVPLLAAATGAYSAAQANRMARQTAERDHGKAARDLGNAAAKTFVQLLSRLDRAYVAALRLEALLLPAVEDAVGGGVRRASFLSRQRSIEKFLRREAGRQDVMDQLSSLGCDLQSVAEAASRIRTDPVCRKAFSWDFPALRQATPNVDERYVPDTPVGVLQLASSRLTRASERDDGEEVVASCVYALLAAGAGMERLSPPSGRQADRSHRTLLFLGNLVNAQAKEPASMGIATLVSLASAVPSSQRLDECVAKHFEGWADLPSAAVRPLVSFEPEAIAPTVVLGLKEIDEWKFDYRLPFTPTQESDDSGR